MPGNLLVGAGGGGHPSPMTEMAGGKNTQLLCFRRTEAQFTLQLFPPGSSYSHPLRNFAWLSPLSLILPLPPSYGAPPRSTPAIIFYTQIPAPGGLNLRSQNGSSQRISSPLPLAPGLSPATAALLHGPSSC